MKNKQTIFVSMQSYLLVGLFLFIPAALLFWNIFYLGSPNWGDSPHFFSNELIELFSEPLSWTQRGANFGGVNLLLWISPLMFVYGLLHKLFSLTSNTITALIFYLPGILYALIGSYFFAKSIKLSNLGSFFVSLIYTFNTYFLLLIDGGQVGMVLAYGIFPLTVLFLRNLITTPTLNSFYLSLAVLTVNSIADPRVALISILTISFWTLLDGKIKNFKYIIFILVAWIAVNFYWIFPLVKNSAVGGESFISNLHLTSILHSLFAFSPHWPGNIFGKVQQPLWYFVGIPFLVFFGLLFSKTKKNYKYLVMFLVFAFLAKGNTYPLGDWYDLLVNLPFGFAFRDSSKFFIPLGLLAGILIANTIEKVSNLLKQKSIIQKTIPVVCYFYILFLVSPALTGKLNFILSDRIHSSDYQLISDKLNQEQEFFRTVWFPERHPLTTEIESKPALDAYTLANSKPFGRINASEDWFNFFYQEDFVDWFKILGIKYLVLSDDPRTIKKTEKELENWNKLGSLLSENESLEKVNWETEIPIYKVSNTYPHIYATDKIYAIIGADTHGLSKKTPTIFMEDGLVDPYTLQGKDPKSVEIVFNDNINEINLTMSFLQKYFVAPFENSNNQWAVFNSNEYLKSKYQLLINQLSFSGLEYNKGIAFSTIDDEKIEFTFDVPKDGSYIYAKRISDGLSSPVWVTKELTISKGKHIEIVTSSNDERILNTVSLIPKEEFQKAESLTKVYLTHFKSYDGRQFIANNSEIKKVNTEQFSPLSLKLTEVPKDSHWIILNDNYNSNWKLSRGIEKLESIPIYSMVNGFYVEDTWTKVGVEYAGQRNVRWGLYLSTISILILSIYYLWKKSDERKIN